MKGNVYVSTDSRRCDVYGRPQRIRVVYVTGSGYALCAPFINHRYRTDAKSVRMIRKDRLTPASHWKLVRAA